MIPALKIAAILLIVFVFVWVDAWWFIHAYGSLDLAEWKRDAWAASIVVLNVLAFIGAVGLFVSAMKDLNL